METRGVYHVCVQYTADSFAVKISELDKDMHFEIVGEIQCITTISSGRGIRELRRLNRIYGKTTWRKRKGIAKIRLEDGTIRIAELHWYEGHGNGRKETKIKKYLE